MAGLYIHVPFCARRCTYCDFYFVTTAKTHTPFLRALRHEMAHAGHTYGQKEPIETLYLGGGTPSVLDADELSMVFAGITEHFGAVEPREVTFELNPGDDSPEYLEQLRFLGVTRLSIGVQSFFDSDLQEINRSHDAAQANGVIANARNAGFDNFSIDLIFGLPGQPTEYWAANLEMAVKQQVPHISTYGLTIEERTPIYKQIQTGKVTPKSQDEMSDLYRFTMSYLTDSGYEHYEVSNFALPGHRSEHNQLYWEHRNYLGFGPSAHSFWWSGLPARRWANIRNLKRYEALIEGRHSPIELRENLDLDTLANEYIMLRLRTSDGLDLSHLEHAYGVDLYEERLTELAWLESEGLIHPIRSDIVSLSPEGMMLADLVTSKLVLG